MKTIVMKKIFSLCVIVLVFVSCQKDKEMLKGDIVGKITVYNQDLTKSSDNSGVLVSLYSDNTLIGTKITDATGQYHFENIIYGKYNIDLQKESYIKPESLYTINHIGGYSPTIFDGSVNKIPDYVLTIDSVKGIASDYRASVYLKLDGSNKLPFPYYYFVNFVVYCSTDPSVSKDNYSTMFRGAASCMLIDPYYNYANGIMFDIYNIPLTTTYYLRFYLLAYGQNIYSAINKDALGKPSNVITFKWN
jgi:hypothetical protein